MRCRLLAFLDRWCRRQCETFAHEHGLTLPEGFDAGIARTMELDIAAETRNNELSNQEGGRPHAT